MNFFISNNYNIYLKIYFENNVTNDFFGLFWRTAALNKTCVRDIRYYYYILLQLFKFYFVHISCLLSKYEC